jgi:hypothetical protein
MMRLLEVSKANAEFRNFALMRLDETLMSSDLLEYLPSQLAAGAFVMAGEEVGGPPWDSAMEKCSRYSKAEALAVAERMKQERVVVPAHLSAIQTKYDFPRHPVTCCGMLKHLTQRRSVVLIE